MKGQGVLFSDKPYRKRNPMSLLTASGFWKLAAERAVKTVAQTAVALIGAEAFDIFVFDWSALFAVSAGAGILSILSSVASAPVGERQDPSLI